MRWEEVKDMLEDAPVFTEDLTAEQIRNELLEQLPDELDKTPGQFAWNNASPISLKHEEIAQFLVRELLLRSFAVTASGSYLEAHALDHGVEKIMATRAGTSSFLIEGDAGRLLDAGMLVSTEESEDEPAIVFETTENVELDENGRGIVPIRARDAGATGNVPAGTITVHVSDEQGIERVENLEATTGGTDEETDEELRERYFAQVRSQQTSGNMAQYQSWATSISGVGQAYVEPRKYGAGTVVLSLVDSDGFPAAREIKDRVQRYIAPAYEYEIGVNDVFSESYTFDLPDLPDISEPALWFVRVLLQTDALINAEVQDANGNTAQRSPDSSEPAFYELETGAKDIFFVKEPNTSYQLVLTSVEGYETDATIDRVQSVFGSEAHDGVAPVDHRVYIESATSIAVDVSVSLVLADNVTLDEVRGQIESKVESYIQDVSEQEEKIVRRHAIGGLLLDVDGVIDYRNLTLNGTEQNIEAEGNILPTLGAIVYE